MAVQLPRVIPLPLAAEQIGLPVDVLTRLAKSGRIKGVQSDGTLLLDERTVLDMVKGIALRDKIWAKVARFEGETVGTGEAKSIYHIPQRTLYLCIKKGYIRTVGGTSEGGRGKKMLLNKADVAYVSELANQATRPHHLFTPDTVPPHCLNVN